MRASFGHGNGVVAVAIMTMTYAEKLRDPRWQKVKSDVQNRAGFRCEQCGDDRTILNVHHTYYVKDRDPWDYPTEDLLCLCEPCHEKWHIIFDRTRRNLGRLSIVDCLQTMGYIHGLWMLSIEPSDHAIDTNIGGLLGIADALHLPFVQLRSIIDDQGYTTTNLVHQLKHALRQGR